MIKISVLLVEDNMADALLVRELLGEGAGGRFEVEVASHLQDGITMLSNKAFQAILLDLGLPGYQGMETLSEMLAHAKEVPVIVLTGSKAEGEGTEATRLGAQDYLVKEEMCGEMMERSILYSIERKRAQEEARTALQTFADVINEIPSGLLTFRYRSPDHLELISYNPQGERILNMDGSSMKGRDIDEVMPSSGPLAWKAELLEVLRSDMPSEHACIPLHADRPMLLRVRMFSIPDLKACISLEDITSHMRTEELRLQALRQVDENIARIAALVDEIRNPNQVIMCLAEGMEGIISENLIAQAERIDGIVNRLDDAWVTTEHLRSFLRMC